MCLTTNLAHGTKHAARTIKYPLAYTFRHRTGTYTSSGPSASLGRLSC